MRESGAVAAFVNVTRVSGVLCGIYLLRTFGVSLVEASSSADILPEQWVNYASGLTLGTLLILPWRFVSIRFVWRVLYVVLACAFVNVLGAWLLSVVWAMIHGAPSGIPFVMIISVVIGAQFPALWFMRPAARVKEER